MIIRVSEAGAGAKQLIDKLTQHRALLVRQRREAAGRQVVLEPHPAQRQRRVGVRDFAARLEPPMRHQPTICEKSLSV